MAMVTYVVLLGILNVTLGNDCPLNHMPEQMAWEKVLQHDLTACNSLPHAPPNEKSSELLTVNFGSALKYFNFDSKDNIITIQTWTFLAWTDKRITWDPKNYFGINETEMTSGLLWTPTIRLYSNSADSFDFDLFYLLHCTVKSTGHVRCVDRTILQTECSAILTNWPYDVQECTLEFGAYSYTSKLLNFKMNFSSRAMSISGAEQGAEWYITDYKQVTNHSSERQLKMIFVLEREAAGLAAVVVYPAVILTALSITCLFMDARRHMRLAVACFSLLCHYYFLTELSQDIPKQSAFPPTILLYYRGSVVLTVVIILFTFLLTAICKMKSTPQNYIISVNDYVYERYGKYFVFPRWDCDDGAVDSKQFSEDWIKFATVVNSGFVFIIIIAYISLYGSLMPKPGPVTRR